jgi:putative DNA primase/helicase
MQEASLAPLSAAEAAELIDAHLDGYLNHDGPDSETADIDIGREAGLPEGEIRQAWAEAFKVRPKPDGQRLGAAWVDRPDGGGRDFAADLAAEVARQRSKPKAAQAEGFFKNPTPQPSVAEAQPEGPKAEPAEEKPEAEQPAAEPPLLNPQAPLDIAREYAQRQCRVGGLLAVWFWQSQFWKWNGRCYETISDEQMRGQLYDFLDGAQRVASGQLVKFLPTPRHVNEVLDCLKSCLALPLECAPPTWLDDRRRAPEIVAFANGLVNVLTGEAQPLTSRLWAQGSLGFEWQREAKAPTWERFLGDVFEDDPESQECLEQWMGYCMTEETKFQKAVMLIGPRRSGKGTISHVLRHLVGDRLYVGLSFNTWTANENSRQCLIGKRVGVFADVRFKSGRLYGSSYDPGGINHVSAELLLNITGEDTVTIGRKYEGPWHGQLKLKLMLISNEVPNLNDGNGVLPSRFVKIRFVKSFYGHEDPELRGKLEAELPGIAARCVRAYQRLCAAGRFVQPQSGLALDREVMRASDPWRAMFDECFVVDFEAMVSKSKAFERFVRWTVENGRPDLRTTPANFTRRLEGLVPTLSDCRPHGQPRAYVGLRLRKPSDPPDPP